MSRIEFGVLKSTTKVWTTGTLGLLAADCSSNQLIDTL